MVAVTQQQTEQARAFLRQGLKGILTKLENRLVHYNTDIIAEVYRLVGRAELVYKNGCRIAQKIGQSVAIVLKVAGSSPATATNGETAAALPHSCHNV